MHGRNVSSRLGPDRPDRRGAGPIGEVDHPAAAEVIREGVEEALAGREPAW